MIEGSSIAAASIRSETRQRLKFLEYCSRVCYHCWYSKNAFRAFPLHTASPMISAITVLAYACRTQADGASSPQRRTTNLPRLSAKRRYVSMLRVMRGSSQGHPKAGFPFDRANRAARFARVSEFQGDAELRMTTGFDEIGRATVLSVSETHHCSSDASISSTNGAARMHLERRNTNDSRRPC